MSHYDPAREQRDEATRAWHNMAASPGDDRLLLRTTAGELHSYRAEEIGFTTSRSGTKLRTGTGMLVMAILCSLMALIPLYFAFTTPEKTGDEQTGMVFAALFVMGIGLMFLAYWRRENRAKRLRRKRKLPEPILDSHG
ncbi:hypothetical protein [Paeniglutamicibacter cryotolerans]|uniref:Uncharacterized protein n=1 Tax=Paeniglutamicibacter cryotolerans TaxID=670079 RepID=A0A839QLG2_9MICC|nr:hypothetical protein [Paeniglutamicibacter cryotolerans]MBB2994022.1 hypothetical protein [Paeniglutamicibacter cryotolerans]